MKKIIIAIDGFAACGKSTLAKGLAHELGYVYLDTGAMYRALTWYFLENRYDWDDPTQRADVLGRINLKFENREEGQVLLLNEQQLQQELRSFEVSDKVCDLAAIPEVRAKLVGYQREIGETGGIVMDGRDIGTVVFPKAELKLFVRAEMEVRVERRFAEARRQGLQVTREEVLYNLKKRDLEETTRTESPLIQADDAILFDNTALDPTEQLQKAIGLAQTAIEKTASLS